VHQQFINYPNFSVFDNIAAPLKVAGLPKAEIKDRVGKIAELLKLSPLLDRRPLELSGGQQQRTALARALVKDSDLVLLDEPLANLDYKLREELRDELPRLIKDRGATVVYATSEPEEALLLGGHTACLHEGCITQFGKTADIYRQPHDLLSAKVFSDQPINIAPVTKHDGVFQLNGTTQWPVTGPQQKIRDGKYIMAIRPHQVVPAEKTANGNALSIEGTVLVTELSGSESVVRFELDGNTWISQSHGIHSTPVGSQAIFQIDTAKCLYFNENDHHLASAGSQNGGAG